VWGYEVFAHSLVKMTAVAGWPATQAAAQHLSRQPPLVELILL
jgi:hypothetical protein